MICYKDKTYCRFEDCKNFGDKKGDCDRSLTKEVEKEAEKFGLLICSFAERPDCFETKLNTKE